MLLPIRTLCGKRDRKDGARPIFIQYCYSSSRRTLLNTGISIPAKFWNKKHRRISTDLPAEWGNGVSLNEELQRMLRMSEDIIAYALKTQMSDPLKFLKDTFHPRFEVSNLGMTTSQIKPEQKINLNFFFQFEDYINSQKKKVTPGMVKVYNNIKVVLNDFHTYRQKEITFDEIDFNFYEELLDYLLYEHVHRRRKDLRKGLRHSTAGRIIKQLRIFLRNRMRRKIISPINLEDFKIIDEESDAIYLNEPEIRQIHKADLSEFPHLQKYRDLLVFGCLTGLRFSDFTTIKSDDVRGKRLYKKQIKSDHWVVIPLREVAYNIFTSDFKRNIPNITNPDFNYYIKEVGKHAGIDELITFSHKKGNKDIVETKPKYQWITSHTCRRSFCTNEFLAGMPVELIMKISGHKSLRDFYKYILITPEQAAKQVEKIWQERELQSCV
jgi:site-specific recombinase XerD